MHVLDDPLGLSARAQAFLARVAWRELVAAPPPSEFLSVRDASGGLRPPTMELIVRRESFALRFAGLRYTVRRVARLREERLAAERVWDYDLGRSAWHDTRGGHFDWIGEHVSSPVRHVIHADGRAGVRISDRFLEIASSPYHLIESHALVDMLADWEPGPGGLEAWVGSNDNPETFADINGLVPVHEASGGHERWMLSEHLAVRIFDLWTDQLPRRQAVHVWYADQTGARLVRDAQQRAAESGA
jgi:hypothetical protein